MDYLGASSQNVHEETQDLSNMLHFIMKKNDISAEKRILKAPY